MRNRHLLLLAVVLLAGAAGIALLAGVGAGSGPGDSPPAGVGPGTVPGPAPSSREEVATGTDAPEGPSALEMALLNARQQKLSELPFVVEEILGFAETEAGVTRLIEILRTSDDDETRALVLLALAKSPIARGREAVRDAAAGRLDPRLRVSALVALGEDPHDESSAFLANTIGAETDEALVAAAIQALVFQNTPAAQKAVADTLRVTTDPGKRRMLWTALRGDVLPGGGAQPSITQEVWGLFAVGFNPMPDDPVAEEAVETIVRQAEVERGPAGTMLAGGALLAIPGPRTDRAFQDLWERDLPAPVRLDLIGRVDPGRAGPKVTRILESAPGLSDPEARRMLAGRAAEITWPEDVPLLREWRRQEKDEEVRRELDAAIRLLEERR